MTPPPRPLHPAAAREKLAEVGQRLGAATTELAEAKVEAAALAKRVLVEAELEKSEIIVALGVTRKTLDRWLAE